MHQFQGCGSFSDARNALQMCMYQECGSQQLRVLEGKGRDVLLGLVMRNLLKVFLLEHAQSKVVNV